MDEIQDYGLWGGLDAAVQVPADVPTAFNDTDFSVGMTSPDDPWFGASQSMVGGDMITTDGDQVGNSVGTVDVSKYSQGFMDIATKVMASLRGNSGQDRNAATGRARPQRSVADLLGLGGAAGPVNPSAPGNQGMWMLMVMGGALLLIMLVAGKR